MKLHSLAIHAGSQPMGESCFVSSVSPLDPSASFFYKSASNMAAVANGELEGYVYQRYGNPTAHALQQQIAALEGGNCAIATSSGMAALHIGLLTCLADRPKTILAANVLFGQTFQLLQMLEQQGIITSFRDPCNLGQFKSALEDGDYGCVLLESLSNPMMRVPAVDQICEMAHQQGVPVVLDATFSTPVLHQPLKASVDVVVHSATKYLSGHADVLGGIVLCQESLEETIRPLSRHLGAGMGPFDCFLTMRGIKTLPLRMEEHCMNARHIARILEEHPRVERVHYPGLDSHPDHEIAARLFAKGPDGKTLCGGMVSFELFEADTSLTFRFMNALKLVVRALSLGDIHSLITHPATSTHRNLGDKHRQGLGIGDNMVRMSVGIEDRDDIAEDLLQALKHLN